MAVSIFSGCLVLMTGRGWGGYYETWLSVWKKKRWDSMGLTNNLSFVLYRRVQQLLLKNLMKVKKTLISTMKTLKVSRASPSHYYTILFWLQTKVTLALFFYRRRGRYARALSSREISIILPFMILEDWTIFTTLQNIALFLGVEFYIDDLYTCIELLKLKGNFWPRPQLAWVFFFFQIHFYLL